MELGIKHRKFDDGVADQCQHAKEVARPLVSKETALKNVANDTNSELVGESATLAAKETGNEPISRPQDKSL